MLQRLCSFGVGQGHGLQDAERGVIFQDFPPVLHLQLKRFEFDYRMYTHRKINDRSVLWVVVQMTHFISVAWLRRLEFTDTLNLAEYLETPTECNYKLHAVLVHSGEQMDGRSGLIKLLLSPLSGSS